MLSQESVVVGIENEIISLQDELESNQLKINQLDVSSQQSINTLAKAIEDYVGDNLIFSTDGLSVSDVIAPHLTELQANQPILRVTVDHSSKEHTYSIPAYINEASAQRVLPGMQALLTPVGMSRAQYGGFYGVVQSSTLLPQVTSELINQLGDSGAAMEITSQLPRPVLLKIKLR